MTYELIILDEAENDLHKIGIHYEGIELGLGGHFLAEVDLHIGYIFNNPVGYEVK